MSRTLARALAGLVKGLSYLENAKRARRTMLLVRDELTQTHPIRTNLGALKLICTAAPELHYVDEFAVREPETLAWIEQFETPCTFWDVGANTGMYALYAALRPGVGVYAFEPVSATYAALCANIRANGLNDRISAFCLAFSDRTQTGRIDMHDAGAGSAGHSIDGLGAAPGAPVLHEDVLVTSIDAARAAFAFPTPNYLKIDVDSIEDKIVAGAERTLADQALRSVLIELAPNEKEKTQRVAKIMEDNGFSGVRADVGDRTNVIFTRVRAA